MSDDDGSEAVGISDDGGAEPHPLVGLLQRATPTPIRRSFTVKFGLMLAVMAVAIGGVGLVATEQISAETGDRVERQFMNSTQQKAEVVTEWRASHRVSTQLLSAKEVWTSDDADRIATSLESERTQLGDDVHELHVINESASGPAVVASTSRRPSQPVTGDERPFLQNTSRVSGLAPDSMYISDTYEVNRKPVVGFVTPVTERPNRLLVVEMSLSGVREALQSGGSRRVEVVDSESKTVVIGGRVRDTLTTYASGERALEPVREATALRDDDSAAGVIAEMPATQSVVDQPYTVGYAPVPNSDWVVLLHSPRSAEFGFVTTVSEYGMYATALAVLLIGITGAVIGYSTSTAIDRLTDKTEQMQEGNLDVSLSTSRVDNIGRLYDGFAEMRDALQTQIQEAERARKQAEVSQAETMELNTHLESQAESYSAVMEQCAAGDLTQRMPRDEEHDSMDRIAESFNDMIAELEKTVGQLDSYVDEVETAGSEVEQSARTVRTASEEVADAIQTIAVDSDEQKAQVRSLADDVAAVGERLDEVAEADDARAVAEQAEEIQAIAAEMSDLVALSEDMQTEADTISAAAEEQAAELTQVSERANDLQRYASPLRDILDRFETEAEHEFVFSVGPTGSGEPADSSQ